MSDMINMVNSVNKVISDSGCLKKKGILGDKLSYVEDKIKKAELSGKKRRSPKANEWLGRVNSFTNEVSELRTKLLESEDDVVMFLFSGGLLPQLIETANTLVDQTPHLDELLIDVSETRGVAFLTTKMVGKAFEENFERIWRLLEVREVSSIEIYSMAGVGKTVLAKCINNRLLGQSQSPVCVFWITISREFTVGSLQEKIARLISVSLLDDDDADIKAATLHRLLSQMKNLVLIFDDVWEYIDLLKVGCPVSIESCRLIITTRSLEVCRQILCQKVITVEKLREDEAWKLLREKEIEELNPHVEETAKYVARFCDGYPLELLP